MAKLKSINPTTGKELGSVKIATKADVERVVEKARRAFPEWRETPLTKRAKIVKKIALLLEKNSERLGELIALEMGKPLVEAVDEVVESAKTVRFLAKEGLRVLRDEVIEPKLSQVELSKMKKTEGRGCN